MVISELVWSDDRVAHIARHRVQPKEVEHGPNPVYQVLGQSDAGRYLLCVIISFPDGRGYPVTAREMTAPEKQRYAGWKKV